MRVTGRTGGDCSCRRACSIEPRWALAILDGGRVIKLVIAGTAHAARSIRRACRCPALDAKGLAAWAKALGVGAVIAIDRGVISALSAEIEGALRLDQDLVEQGLVALRALKKHAGTGVWTEPPLLDLLPDARRTSRSSARSIC